MTTESTPPRSRLLIALVLSAFFVSGIAGLVHEVIWIRLLRHVMGNSTFAISMVLTVFMGGLALGSFLAGRLAGRLRRPLIAFAFLELGIGLYGLALPYLLDLAQPLYRGLYAAADGNFVVVTFARFVVSAVMLLIPATLMGTTLPILAHLFEGKAGKRMGAGLGTLYAVNTLGAAVGAASAGFLWIPRLGMSRTILLAAVLNGLVALAGLILAKKFGSREPAPKQQSFRGGDSADRGPWRGLLLAYGASGFSALVYEVAWTRVLSAQIGSTVYAFSMMLTAFILGLGLGSLLAEPLVRRLKRPALTLAFVQALIAVACIAVVPLFEWLPVHLTGWIAESSDGGFFGLQRTLFGVLLMVMLVPTLLIGACFPLVARLAMDGGFAAARSVGTIYSANTIGTILGSFVAGFLLIPTIGTQNTIAIGVSVNGLVAAGLFLLAPRLDRQAPNSGLMRVYAALTLIVSMAVFLVPTWNRSTMSFGPFMLARRDRAQSTDAELLKTTIAEETERGGILFQKEGLNTTVTVRKDPYGEVSLWVNGKPDASSSVDMPTQVLSAQLPLLLHPNPSTGMLVGLASGITLGSMNTHPLERIDCAEISQAVVEGSAYFNEFNGRALEDPRVNLIVEDGRNHLSMTDERYDVISSEPSNPWIAGVADLFTKEYFTICRDRLNDQGVACFWLAHYNLDEHSFRSVVRTFLDVYPSGLIWNPLESDYLLIGCKGDISVNVEALAKRMAEPKIAKDLARVGIASIPDLFEKYLCGAEEAASLAGEVVRHTDDNALLEFAAPRNVVRYNDEISTYEKIEANRDTDVDFLTGAGSTEMREVVNQRMRAVGLVVQGRLHLRRQRLVQALQAAKEAQALAPNSASLQGLIGEVSAAISGEGGLMAAGRLDEAAGALELLLSVEPRSLRDQLTYGDLMFGRKRMRRAADAFNACLQLSPGMPDAALRLAYIHATAPGEALFQPARAVELAELAIQATGRSNALAMRSLAVAYAAVGKFDAAVQVTDEAAALLSQAGAGPGGLASEFQAMRKAFTEGRPWRAKR